MTDTPRTDAAYAASTRSGIFEFFKEAQDMERELARSNERIMRLIVSGNIVEQTLLTLSPEGCECFLCEVGTVCNSCQKIRDASDHWNKCKEEK